MIMSYHVRRLRLMRVLDELPTIEDAVLYRQVNALTERSHEGSNKTLECQRHARL